VLFSWNFAMRTGFIHKSVWMTSLLVLFHGGSSSNCFCLFPIFWTISKECVKSNIFYLYDLLIEFVFLEKQMSFDDCKMFCGCCGPFLNMWGDCLDTLWLLRKQASISVLHLYIYAGRGVICNYKLLLLYYFA